MSEEVLKALMQLFAIIAKQDEGVETKEREYVKNFLTQQLNEEASEEYYALFESYSNPKEGEENGEETKQDALNDFHISYS